MKPVTLSLAVVVLGVCLFGCASIATAEETDRFNSMVRVNGCEVVRQNESVILTSPTHDRSLVQTADAFRPPFVVRLKAKTDSTNLRLYYNAGMVIFNWEVRKTELRVHDPLTDRQTGSPSKGYITPNEWHDIVWEIKPEGMQVSVDGEERFRGTGDYSGIDAPVGLGPAFGSVVSVQSCVIDPL